jgi:hypothetical protein
MAGALRLQTARATVATQRLFAGLHVQLRLVYAAAPSIWRGTIHRECVQSFRLQPAIGAQMLNRVIRSFDINANVKAKRGATLRF